VISFDKIALPMQTTTSEQSKKTSQVQLILGADHGGFEAKETLKLWMIDQGWQVIDLGANQYEPDDDYPAIAFSVAERVQQVQQGQLEQLDTTHTDNSPSTSVEETQPLTLGILFCRSGGGMTIAANKVKGIRAVPVYSTEQADHARTDNDAQIISLAADWTGLEEMKAIILTFVQTPFSAALRHRRRISAIARYEERT